MKRISIIISFIACIAMWVNANDISDLAKRIAASSPERKALLQKVSANHLNADTENNLDDPELSVETLFGKGDNKYNIGLSQSFEWPGLYKARKERNQAAMDAETAEVEVFTAETRQKAEAYLINLIGARKRAAAYSESLAVMQKLLDLYTRLYARGDVTVIDVNKLRIEVADLTQSLDDEKQNIADIYGALSAMSQDIDIEAATATLTEFPLYTLEDKDTYLRAMEQNSPELKYLRAKGMLDQSETRVASMSSRPGFSVGYRYSYEDAQSYNGFSLGLTLPFWSAKGKKEAAQAAALTTTLDGAAATATMRAQIDTDYKTAQSIHARIVQYSGALNTTDNTGLLRRAFDAGQITLTEYLQDMRYFIEAQVRLFQLQQDYSTAVASLERYL